MSEEKVLELVITAGATLLAAFLGAGAAVWFAHRVDRAKQTAALAHSCNVALVTLRGRAGLINAIKSGVLEKFRSNPARHLVLHAAVVPWKTAEKVDLASLAFLLGTSDMALFDEFYRLDEVSEVFHTALTLRTAAYVASLDPVLNELGMTGVGLSSEQVELVRSKLAPVTDAKLMHLTNQLYSYADQATHCRLLDQRSGCVLWPSSRGRNFFASVTCRRSRSESRDAASSDASSTPFEAEHGSCPKLTFQRP